MLKNKMGKLLVVMVAGAMMYSTLSGRANVGAVTLEGAPKLLSTITATSTIGVTVLNDVFRLSNRTIAYRAGKSTDVISNLDKYSLTDSKLNDPVLYFILNGSIDGADPLDDLSIRQTAIYVVNDSSFDLSKIEKSEEFKTKVTDLVNRAKEYKEIMLTGNFIKSVYTEDDLVTDSKGETKLITLPNLLGVSYSVKSISDGAKVVNNWGNPVEGELTSFKVKCGGSFKLVLSCKVTNFTLRYVKSTEKSAPSLITSDSSDTFNKDVVIEKVVKESTPSSPNTTTPINFNYNLDILGLDGEHVEGIKIGLFKDGNLVKELLTSASTLTETVTQAGVYEWRVLEMDNPRYYIPDSNISIVKVDKSAGRSVTLQPSEKSKFDFKNKTVGSIYEVKSATPSSPTAPSNQANTSDGYAIGFIIISMALAGFLEFLNRTVLKKL